jgi:hypothetical protein
MHIPVNAIRIAQRHLRDGGFDPGPVDGQLGPRTEAALDRALAARRNDLAPQHADGILGRSRRRKVTAYIQLLASDAGIESGAVDGFWGPQTDFAFGVLEHLEELGELPHPWRDFTGPEANPNGWPLETEADLRAFYGAPGTPPKGLVALPEGYPSLRLSWDLTTSTRKIACHEKVAVSLERVLAGVLEEYGAERIRELRLDRYGGCYSKRKKRGGTSWSTHAWGIALDFDPERNRLQWGRDRAAFARPEYDRWWALWEAEGWISLGRVANFDWMHVQAARRP